MKTAHVAYCSGPAQLVYLLAALDAYGAARGSCEVWLESNPDGKLYGVMQRLVKGCGMRSRPVSAAQHLGSPSEVFRAWLAFLRDRRLDKGGSGPCLWFSRGIVASMPVFNCYLSLGSRRIVEYFDGFRTPIVIQEEQHPNWIGPSEPGFKGIIKRLLWRRAMPPAQQFVMPEGLGWEDFAGENHLRRTIFIPSDDVVSAIEEVGRALQQESRQPIPTAFDVMLLPGLLAERNLPISLEMELLLYRGLLESLSSRPSLHHVLVKPHPRSSRQKLGALAELAAEFGAALTTDVQLSEFICRRAASRDIWLVGEPSTALLTARRFQLGRPFCLGFRLMLSYVGEAYRKIPYKRADHEFMDRQSVPMIETIDELLEG